MGEEEPEEVPKVLERLEEDAEAAVVRGCGREAGEEDPAEAETELFWLQPKSRLTSRSVKRLKTTKRFIKLPRSCVPSVLSKSITVRVAVGKCKRKIRIIHLAKYTTKSVTSVGKMLFNNWLRVRGEKQLNR